MKRWEFERNGGEGKLMGDDVGIWGERKSVIVEPALVLFDVKISLSVIELVQPFRFEKRGGIVVRRVERQSFLIGVIGTMDFVVIVLCEEGHCFLPMMNCFLTSLWCNNIASAKDKCGGG